MSVKRQIKMWETLILSWMQTFLTQRKYSCLAAMSFISYFLMVRTVYVKKESLSFFFSAAEFRKAQHQKST